MQRLFAPLLMLVPFLFAAAQEAPAPAAELPWKPFDQALAASAENGKKVMVFIYTDWCGWCRKLQKEVFTDETIQAYLARHYEIARLNAESENQIVLGEASYSEGELAAGLGGSGFPLTVFVQSKGGQMELITKLPGYQPAGEYLSVLRYIAEEAFLSQSFEEYLQAQ